MTMQSSQDDSKAAALVGLSDCPEMTEEALFLAERSLLDVRFRFALGK